MGIYPCGLCSDIRSHGGGGMKGSVNKMKPEEAIEIIKDHFPSGYEKELCEALDVAIEATEKQVCKGLTAKKRIVKEFVPVDCPTCDFSCYGKKEYEMTIDFCNVCGKKLDSQWHSYCANCGQKVEEEEEEKE